MAPPVTVRERTAACPADGLAPLTTIWYVPETAAVVVFRVRVEEPPAVTEAGLREAVTPAGRPLTVRFTVRAAPAVTAVVTVAVVEDPAATVAEAGVTATEKSSAGAVVPLVKGAKTWEKSQVFCWMPEQLSAAAAPGQPPLSRWRPRRRGC